MPLQSKYVNQVTPQEVIKLYGVEGITLTVEQTNQVLEFMYMIAEFALEDIMKEFSENGSNS